MYNAEVKNVRPALGEGGLRPGIVSANLCHCLLALDHGQSSARQTKPAFTGLDSM